jgi:hypothetical protein
MRIVPVLLVAAILSVASSRAVAQSVAYRFDGASLSSSDIAGDPGLRLSQQMVTAFDGEDTLNFDAARSSGYGFFTGNHVNVAAAPAGDVTRYAAIGAGGSMLFDLRQYNTPSSVLTSLSAYLGSVDVYNAIDIIGLTAGGDLDYATPLLTVTGSDLIGAGSSHPNGRITFGFDGKGQIGGIVFRSSGIAFEFDSIAIGVDRALPPPGLVATPAPEPASWAMMLVGFGAVGGALRARRRTAVAFA